MNIMIKIYDFLFPLMSLDERVKKWCSLIGKDSSYGSKMTHDELDKINFHRRRFVLKYKNNNKK